MIQGFQFYYLLHTKSTWNQFKRKNLIISCGGGDFSHAYVIIH
jgi:hypothetical protein